LLDRGFLGRGTVRPVPFLRRSWPSLSKSLSQRSRGRWTLLLQSQIPHGLHSKNSCQGALSSLGARLFLMTRYLTTLSFSSRSTTSKAVIMPGFSENSTPSGRGPSWSCTQILRHVGVSILPQFV